MNFSYPARYTGQEYIIYVDYSRMQRTDRPH